MIFVAHGAMTVDGSQRFADGEAWHGDGAVTLNAEEAGGPERVFAQGAADRPSRFIRVMILPRALLGKSSVEYLNDDDKAKPKTQQYRIFADAPIALPAA